MNLFSLIDDDKILLIWEDKHNWAFSKNCKAY